MAENARISPASVHRFLQSRLGAGIEHVEPLESGAWSRVYSFVRDGERYVIRLSDYLENFERDALAATFNRDGLPVPPITDLGIGLGGYYAISPHIEGVYLESLPAPALEAAMPSILRMFSALRGVDLSASRGFGDLDGAGNGVYSSWREFLLAIGDDREGSLIHGWRVRLENSPLGTETFDLLYGRLKLAVQHCPEDRYLVHSDLIHGNVLVSGGEISAVLDWGSSLIGDALYDIVWIAFWQPWHPNFTEVNLARQLFDHYLSDLAANKRDVDARMNAYRLHIGLDSISYNASRSDWKNASDAANYTLRITS